MHGLENEEGLKGTEGRWKGVCLRVSKVVAVSERPWLGERKPREESRRVLVLPRKSSVSQCSTRRPRGSGTLPTPPVLNIRSPDPLGAGCHLQWGPERTQVPDGFASGTNSVGPQESAGRGALRSRLEQLGCWEGAGSIITPVLLMWSPGALRGCPGLQQLPLQRPGKGSGSQAASLGRGSDNSALHSELGAAAPGRAPWLQLGLGPPGLQVFLRGTWPGLGRAMRKELQVCVFPFVCSEH